MKKNNDRAEVVAPVSKKTYVEPVITEEASLEDVTLQSGYQVDPVGDPT